MPTTEASTTDSSLPISSKSPTHKTPSQDSVDTSKRLMDTHHSISEKPKKFNGPEWRKACDESFVPGVPRKFIGTCPPNIEQIARMSKTRQKFFLTQDPRKTQCLVNPGLLHSKKLSQEKEFNALTNMVKYAQNTVDSTEDMEKRSEESVICEVIDLENPLQLDFQGMDYKNTYQLDEQDLQNQRNYRRVERYMERRRVKAETKVNVEEELHQERIRIPRGFDVRDRNTPRTPTPPPEPNKLGELFRSADKEINREIINKESSRRYERYRSLYLANKTRQDQKKERLKKEEEIRKENIGLIKAEQNFQKISHKMDTIIKRSLKANKDKERDVYGDATKKEMMKGEEKREKFIQKPKENLSTFNKPENQDLTLNAPQVGKIASKFKLRGNLDYYAHKEASGKGPNCITRDQWLQELVPKREKIKLDVEVGLQKSQSPDDPNLRLFTPKFGYKPPKQDHSAIREYQQKPLGCQYDRVLRKNLKLLKPHLRYSVKKFNLVSYRFGSTAKRLAQFNGNVGKDKDLRDTDQYIENKHQEETKRQNQAKLRRLQLLGIPCRVDGRNENQIENEDFSSSSTDSEWVPAKDSLELSGKFDNHLRDIIPLVRRTNMPAPKFREPTLRQHPKRPRDYEALRIPSEEFDKVVEDSTIPYLYKLQSDLIDPANAGLLQHRPYNKMLEVRHHHDHWNPIQQQTVDVHYQPRKVKPEITEEKNIKKETGKEKENEREIFQKAQPPCSKYVEKNITMPKWNMDEILRNYKFSSYKKAEENTEAMLKAKDLCKPQDFILSTRDPKELQDLQYPGREEYLKFLNEIKSSIKESQENEDPQSRLYGEDKASLLKDLQEEIHSIESCLTSLSSSQCTNFTNDSGSYLLMEGKEKIPLDYIRKSLVPFEELHRSRFRFEPIDVQREEDNPYRVLPFSGQIHEQRKLSAPKDKFYTFNTRLRSGLRLRLQVPPVNVAQIKIGPKGRKYKNIVATDIDENYVQVLKNRSSVKMFKYKTTRNLIKDALRLKFESMVVQGEMVRSKIYDRINDEHWSHMLGLKELYEKLFDKWEKTEYDSAMAVVYKVKDVYDETDRLRKDIKEMEKDQVILNMDIVFIEGHWIRCIMLQNFHYLMGDLEWRLQNDWIHRITLKEITENVTQNGPSENTSSLQISDSSSSVDEIASILLENFEESIMKRSKVNIRQRDKDDAWAIKTFYEEIYLPNKHPNLIVFPNAHSFLQGLENLKTKTFILLLEMHFALTIHSELQDRLESFLEWCMEDLKEKKEYVSRKCAKLYFMEDRAAWLRKQSLSYLDKPVDESFNDVAFLKDRALVAEAWRRIVPANMRGSSEDLLAVDMVAMMSQVVMDLIAKFESIPMEDCTAIENKLRKRRNYRRKQSHHACHVEKRIEQEMQKVVRNLEPPPTLEERKSKRPKKLQRLYLRKRTKAPSICEKKISERAKFFFEAFHEDGADITKPSEIRDSIAQVDAIQEQIVPFYFDHFLKLNGYTPDYNFKTQIELRDGPELDRLKIRSVIPEIQQRMLQWEAMKKKIMEDHIAQNPNMYVNVV
ncbi:uncharacterized protein LOC142220816 [Haematobia irritans]|uniref:uncharacterized protein LOC142220816 n=1 Tax=Haematobia irritans TaxID=7368 RepID=UPI003F4F431D